MSTDPAFFKRLETPLSGPRLRHSQGRAPRARHVVDQVRPRRGPHVDLTNRCNMMCNPCFMDANQVGYVHELDVGRRPEDPRRRGLDQAAAAAARSSSRAASPRSRLTSSGGPLRARGRLLLRPGRDERHPLRAGAGLRPRGAGGGAALRLPPVRRRRRTRRTQHRKVGNLFDVKLRAIDNLHAAGVDVTLVTTIVNSVNNHQVGRHPRTSRSQNIDKINDRLLPARLLHGPRRGDRRRDAREAALHALAPRARRRRSRRESASRCATGFRSRRRARSRDLEGPPAAASRPTGAR